MVIAFRTLTNGFKTLLYSNRYSYVLPIENMLRGDLLASRIAALFHLNTSAVEDEILIVQHDIELNSRAHGQYGSLLTKEKYPNIRKCATSLTILFHSAYLCQSAFPTFPKKRSTIADVYLEACMRLAPSSFCPDYATLADFIQCKSSEHVLSELINICLEFFYVGR